MILKRGAVPLFSDFPAVAAVCPYTSTRCNNTSHLYVAPISEASGQNFASCLGSKAMSSNPFIDQVAMNNG